MCFLPVYAGWTLLCYVAQLFSVILFWSRGFDENPPPQRPLKYVSFLMWQASLIPKHAVLTGLIITYNSALFTIAVLTLGRKMRINFFFRAI